MGPNVFFNKINFLIYFSDCFLGLTNTKIREDQLIFTLKNSNFILNKGYSRKFTPLYFFNKITGIPVNFKNHRDVK